jgi:hypothetical protein
MSDHASQLTPPGRTLLVAFFVVGSTIAVMGTWSGMQPVALAGLTAAGSAVAWFIGKAWLQKQTPSP